MTTVSTAALCDFDRASFADGARIVKRMHATAAGRSNTPPLSPGRGASLLDRAGNAMYAYAARSRRAGGASLGVDLTPGQECSLACVYCQVPRTRPRLSHERPAVDVARLHNELDAMLRSPPDEGWADLAVAGSGEPTLVVNFEPALARILEAAADASFTGPKRLYTNGLHLEKRAVRHALANWANKAGQIWIKIDALNDEMCKAIWRRRVTPATHVARIWNFAKEQPVGIQTTMMHGSAMVCPETLAHQLAAVINWGLFLGAKFLGVQLIAPSRAAGDLSAMRAAQLAPATLDELQIAAHILRTEVNLPVHVFA